MNAAFHNAARKPSNFPRDPAVTYSAKAPYCPSINMNHSCRRKQVTYRFFPVPKTIRIMIWVSSNHRNEGEGEDDSYQNYFATREPKFTLSIPFNGKEIDDTMLVRE